MNVPIEYQLWDTHQVLQVKGNSRPTLWRDIAAGRFPAPDVKGRGRGRNLWFAQKVIIWQREFIRHAKAEQQLCSAESADMPVALAAAPSREGAP